MYKNKIQVFYLSALSNNTVKMIFPLITELGRPIILGDVIGDPGTLEEIKAVSGKSNVNKREAIFGGQWPNKTVYYEFASTFREFPCDN